MPPFTRPAIAGHADFPGANGVEFERIAPNRLRFQMLKHGSPAVLWWQFVAQVPVGERVFFELVNTADTLCNPRGWNCVRPVYSYDRIRWRRLAAKDCRFDAQRGRFIFSGVFQKPTVYLAQCYPYHLAELAALQHDLRRSKRFQAGFAGKTEMGRPYPLWRMGEKGSAPGGRKKIGVFLTARLHSGEQHGSIALEGMLREIAFGTSAAARWLRAHCAFLIAPMVDFDGVVEGMFGKDRHPIDFNRDWSAAPLRPEIRRLQQEVDRWSRRVRYAAHFDFHCPCLPNEPHIHSSVPGGTTPRLKQAEEQFARLLERHAPKSAPFYFRDLVFPGYQGPTYEVVCSRYQTAVHGVLGLTPEIAYHPTRRSARDDRGRGPVMEPEPMRRLGAAHATALAGVLQSHRQDIYTRARPFFDPTEAPPLLPVIATATSPYRAWGLLGGDPQAFRERALPAADRPRGAKASSALVLNNAAGQSVFFVTPQMPLTAHAALPALAIRRRGVPTGAAQPGAPLLLHVFYYDRRGARFGRLFGSESVELTPSQHWQRFTPGIRPPAGAKSLRYALSCNAARGRLEFCL